MRRIALVVVLTGLFALPVQGTVTLVSVTRDIGITTPVSDVTTLTQTLNCPVSAPFQDSLYNNYRTPNGTVSAMASQVSRFDLTPGGTLLGGSFAGTAATTAATFTPTLLPLAADTNMSLSFLVSDSPASLNIVGRTSNYLAPTPRLEFWKEGSPVHYLPAFSLSGSPDFTFTKTLAPGLYHLNADIDFSTSAALATEARAGSLEFTFALTPEPASLALLALGGLTMWRRRR